MKATNSLLPIFSPMLLAGAALWVTGCGEPAPPGKPELPQSVSPGWTRKSFGHVAPLDGLPTGHRVDCWKAEYAGTGAAEVWACGFSAESGAFDSAQRYAAGPDRVKFQSGRYLVVVHWSGGSRVEVTALVRALQKALG